MSLQPAPMGDSSARMAPAELVRPATPGLQVAPALETLEAGLIPVEAIPETERRRYGEYYNQALDGIQALRALQLPALPPVSEPGIAVSAVGQAGWSAAGEAAMSGTGYAATAGGTAEAAQDPTGRPTPGPRSRPPTRENWDHPQWKGKHSSELGYLLDKNFDRWDANHDGVLTLDEINAALSTGNLTPEEAAALKVARKEFQTLCELSDDQKGSADAGISRKDLGALARIAREQRSPWVSLKDDELKNKAQKVRENRADQELASGRPTSFTNSSGKTAQVTVTKVSEANGRVTYKVQVGQHSFVVEAPEGLPVLRRLIDMFMDLPEADKAKVKRVEFHQGAKPGHPNAAADDDGAGTIRFFHGDRFLDRDTFFHEVGHEVGRSQKQSRSTMLRRLVERFFGEYDWVPEGWEEAIKKDGNHLTEYSKTNPTEDFAESWGAYMVARTSKDTQKLEELRRKIPNRFAIMDRLYQEKNR